MLWELQYLACLALVPISPPPFCRGQRQNFDLYAAPSERELLHAKAPRRYSFQTLFAQFEEAGLYSHDAAPFFRTSSLKFLNAQSMPILLSQRSIQSMLVLLSSAVVDDTEDWLLPYSVCYLFNLFILVSFHGKAKNSLPMSSETGDGCPRLLQRNAQKRIMCSSVPPSYKFQVAHQNHSIISV